MALICDFPSSISFLWLTGEPLGWVRDMCKRHTRAIAFLLCRRMDGGWSLDIAGGCVSGAGVAWSGGAHSSLSSPVW